MRRRIVLAFLGIATSSAPIAWLPLAPGRAAASTSLVAHVGYARYAMDDVNEILDSPSSFVGAFTVDGGDVESGVNLGAGIRAWAGVATYFEAGATYLSASAEGTAEYDATSYHWEMDASGVGLTATAARYFWRWGEGARAPARLGFAAGGGYHFATGDISVATASGLAGRTDLSGGGPSALAALLGAGALAGSVDLEAWLGYRYARTTRIRRGDDGTDIRMEDGSKATIDWSGPFLRIGLAVHLR